MIIRAFRPEDAQSVSALRWRSVRQIGPEAYSPEQVQAWLPESESVDQVLARIADGRQFWLAEIDGRVAGAVDLEGDGHIDYLYVDPDYTRRGVASQLLAYAEAQASAAGMERLYTEASELARPAFAKAGFVTLRRREFELRGVQIHNYGMEKVLG